MDEIVQLIGALCLFGWVPIMVYFKHKIRLEEIKAQRRGSDVSTLEALRELRREVQALRDTSTKFDVAFDAALSRLEERVERVEARTITTTAAVRTGVAEDVTAAVNRS